MDVIGEIASDSHKGVSAHPHKQSSPARQSWSTASHQSHHQENESESDKSSKASSKADHEEHGKPLQAPLNPLGNYWHRFYNNVHDTVVGYVSDFRGTYTERTRQHSELKTLKQKAKHPIQATYDQAEKLYREAVVEAYRARKEAEDRGEQLEAAVEYAFNVAVDSARKKRDDARAALHTTSRWFSFGGPSIAVETAESIAEEAARRKENIESSLEALGDDARHEMLKVRGEVANTLWSLESSSAHALHQARTSFNDATDEISKRFGEISAKLRSSLLEKKPSNDLRVNELVYAAKSKLHATVSAIQTKFAEADQKGKEEFDIAIKNSAHLKEDYIHVRDRASRKASQLRKQTIDTASDEYERALSTVKGELGEASAAIAAYCKSTGKAAEEKRKLAEQHINAAEQKLAAASRDAWSKLEELERDTRQVWRDAIDEVTSWGSSWSSGMDHIRSSAGHVWGEATKSLASAQTNVQDTIHGMRDKFSGLPNKFHGSDFSGHQGRGLTMGDGGQGLGMPIATFWAAAFAIWFVYLSNRVWKSRRAASIWTGDGTVEAVKATFDSEHVRNRSQASVAAVAETAEEIPESRVPLYTSLANAVADLNSFTSTVPFMLLLLTIMELNGFGPRVLLSLYFGLIVSRFLQQSSGQDMLNDFGFDRDLGTVFSGVLLLVLTALCFWGVALGNSGLPSFLAAN